MSDDLISRQEVIQAIRNERVWVDENIQNPQHHYHIMNETTRILSIVGKLPSVQPKTGRWIPHKAPFLIQPVYSCSKCNSSVPSNIFVVGCDFEFCPYCGAKIENYEGV